MGKRVRLVEWFSPHFQSFVPCVLVISLFHISMAASHVVSGVGALRHVGLVAPCVVCHVRNWPLPLALQGAQQQHCTTLALLGMTPGRAHQPFASGTHGTLGLCVPPPTCMVFSTILYARVHRVALETLVKLGLAVWDNGASTLAARSMYARDIEDCTVRRFMWRC